jgi:predicted RecA/RadA family phage recombinase
MKNFVQPGEVLEMENTTGAAVNSGGVLAKGDVVGVATVDIPEGETGNVAIEGVYELPKASGSAWSQGDKLIWDADAGAFDLPANVTAATGDIKDAGFAAADAGSSNTTGLVALSGLGERVA